MKVRDELDDSNKNELLLRLGARADNEATVIHIWKLFWCVNQYLHSFLQY